MQRTIHVLRTLKCGVICKSYSRTPVGALSNVHRSEYPGLRTRRQLRVVDHVKQFHQTRRREVDDTIYALSTAPGRAAIAVVRISGSACRSIYRQLCPGKPSLIPRVASLRRLQNPVEPERTIDSGALLLHFPGPKTVTGEDVLELQVHGGPAIVRSVLKAVAQCAETGGSSIKIRPAEPGEFTKRAFYNGRIDLAEVEALGDALAAETEQQRRLAVSGAASGLTQRYEQWRSMLLYARGELEALIDFSEDQHFDESPAEFMTSISQQIIGLKRHIELHIANSYRGELLRNGISVALLGAPNAGKSSLLNRIVQREAAIVSEEEGTTRDIVDVTIDIQGWLVRLGDMAGLRATSSEFHSDTSLDSLQKNKSHSNIGEIEKEGIRRAKERALHSDLVIVLISLRLNPNGSAELAINDELVSAIQHCHKAGKDMLYVINKIDLLHTQSSDRKVSISKLLSDLIQALPEIKHNDVFCVSCKDAVQVPIEEADPGGFQTFLAGLTKKFEIMTAAAVDASDISASPMSKIEAQNYWTASLSVTDRQNRYLQECLVHLQTFLETSSVASVKEDLVPSPPQRMIAQNEADHSISNVFFDTAVATSVPNPPQKQIYHFDNHDDIVAAIDDTTASARPLVPKQSSINVANNLPGSARAATDAGLGPTESEEVDIVTAAEHLRHAANSLSKLTGRGDGVSSGSDVEDVLGVIFEK